MQKIAKKSSFLIIFVLILIFLSSILLFSCGPTKITVEEIEFAFPVEKMYVGQSRYVGFNVYPANANNYKCVFTSSDEQIISISQDGVFHAKALGQATITLTESITDKEISLTIEVGDGYVSALDYEIGSMKILYYEGQKIDPTGLQVYKVYQSKQREELSPNEYRLEYPTLATEGCKIKIVYLEDESVPPKYVSLLILPDGEESIEVTSPPNKTTYNYGEIFDPEGLEVDLVYKSGKRVKLEEFSFDNTPIDINQQKIEVFYKNFTVEIEIISKAEIEVSSIEELNAAIEQGYKSIKLKGIHGTPSPIKIDNRDVILIGDDDTKVIGVDILPLQIIGNSNVKIINIAFSSSAKHLVDVSAFGEGTISFENVTFDHTQDKILSNPSESVSFSDCKYVVE